VSEIRNAKIDNTMLGNEDHGIMTAFVYVTFGSGGQGFGGYGFDEYDPETKQRLGTAFGVEFIANVLRVVGVDTWEALPGKHVRIDHDSGKIYRIGHIIEDRWFDPKELAESHFGVVK
jgi:hypothetical protein